MKTAYIKKQNNLSVSDIMIELVSKLKATSKTQEHQRASERDLLAPLCNFFPNSTDIQVFTACQMAALDINYSPLPIWLGEFTYGQGA